MISGDWKPRKGFFLVGIFGFSFKIMFFLKRVDDLKKKYFSGDLLEIFWRFYFFLRKSFILFSERVGVGKAFPLSNVKNRLFYIVLALFWRIAGALRACIRAPWSSLIPRNHPGTLSFLEGKCILRSVAVMPIRTFNYSSWKNAFCSVWQECLSGP